MARTVVRATILCPGKTSLKSLTIYYFVGSMAAGNNSPVIKNDLAMINDEFLKIGAIDKQIHEKFYKKYLK